MAEERRARVALIARATGPHTGGYVNTLPLLARVGEIAVCDLDGRIFDSARDRMGAKFGRTFTDVDACLAAGPYAFVLVSLDNREAPGVISRALAASNHVFSEKLGARTAAEWEPIVGLAEERGKNVCMAYLNRARPSVVEATRLVRSGAIGRLMGFSIQSIATHARLRDPAHSWTFDPERAGGGYLVWLGCHYIDLLRAITGDEVRTVAAVAGKLGVPDLRVEDAIALAMSLDSGAVGCANFGYYLDGDRRTGAKNSHVELWGDLGWIRMRPGEDDEVPLEVYSRHRDFAGAPHRFVHFGHREVPGAYGSGWGLAYLERFVDACLDGTAPPTNARDELAMFRIVDAAYASVREGRIIAIARRER